MKTLYRIILIVSILGFQPVIIANDSFSDAVKFIKLSNTYRESKDYESAIKFLKRAQAGINGSKNIQDSKYWSAAIDESYFYIYRDLGLNEESEKYLNNAIKGFEKIVSQKDGSPLPLDLIRDNLKNLNYQKQLIKPTLTNNIKVLNLDNQKLKSLPGDIPDYIENLSLSHNNFREFPTGVSRLQGLKYLNLSNNRIKNLNIDFGSLKNVHWLNLSKNRLRMIQGNIQELSNIQFLDLSDNALKVLPSGISDLNTLKILNIKGNKLSFETISNLLKKLPNTNILFDEYVLKGEEEITE